MRRILSFASVALICLASASAAQSNKGGISGTVFGESGGVVVAAQVVVTQIGTGESRRIRTSESGSFAVPLLEPADYRVTVDAPGRYHRNLALMAAPFSTATVNRPRSNRRQHQFGLTASTPSTSFPIRSDAAMPAAT